ncbi:hypothetical protein TNCV_1825991 [Trichonephila clavipes]|nr:hypothetical protein TNCV_1825991 [Trichonephila clavipes]
MEVHVEDVGTMRNHLVLGYLLSHLETKLSIDDTTKKHRQEAAATDQDMMKTKYRDFQYLGTLICSGSKKSWNSRDFRGRRQGLVERYRSL